MTLPVTTNVAILSKFR